MMPCRRCGGKARTGYDSTFELAHWFAFRIAATISGAVIAAKPDGLPALRSVIRVPAPSDSQV